MKILTDTDMAEMVTAIVNTNKEKRMSPQYKLFLETIAEAIGSHQCVVSGPVRQDFFNPDNENEVLVSFAATVDTPKDGGLFANYDTDQPVEDWLAENQNDVHM